MDSTQTEVILRRFETPDDVREMVKGRFEIVRLGGLTIGRATYQPGWKWSEHVGPAVGASRCTVEHVGLVLSGTATAAFGDGRVIELRGRPVLHPSSLGKHHGRAFQQTIQHQCEGNIVHCTKGATAIEGWRLYHSHGLRRGFQRHARLRRLWRDQGCRPQFRASLDRGAEGPPYPFKRP